MKIKFFKVEGYRSLKNVEIKDLDSINIFHGENNTGKSNILGALELFFSEKYTFKPLMGGLGEPEIKGEQKEIGFKGRVPTKESDFFIFEENSKKMIKFNVEIQFDEKDIGEIKNKFKGEDEELLEEESILLKVSAEIPYVTEIHNNISYGIFTIKSFKIGDEELIGKKSIKPELLKEIGMYLIGKFSNINSQRQIVKEIDEGDKFKKIGVKNIQKYLHDLSLSDNIKDRLIMNEIVTIFNEINKDIGEITFSLKPSEPKEDIEHDDRGVKTVKIKERNEIKLYMYSTKEKILLPIENFGSGVQQSLIIISNVVANNNAMLYGIEELEANLSPYTQKVFFDKLIKMKNEKKFSIEQLFITSHSPVFKIMEKENTKVYKVIMRDGISSINEMTRKEFIEHMKPAFPSYKYCNECNDIINSSIEKMSKNLGVDVSTTKELYDKHNFEICRKCTAKKICDTTKEEIINFVEKELKEK